MASDGVNILGMDMIRSSLEGISDKTVREISGVIKEELKGQQQGASPEDDKQMSRLKDDIRRQNQSLLADAKIGYNTGSSIGGQGEADLGELSSGRFAGVVDRKIEGIRSMQTIFEKDTKKNIEKSVKGAKDIVNDPAGQKGPASKLSGLLGGGADEHKVRILKVEKLELAGGAAALQKMMSGGGPAAGIASPGGGGGGAPGGGGLGLFGSSLGNVGSSLPYVGAALSLVGMGMHGLSSMSGMYDQVMKSQHGTRFQMMATGGSKGWDMGAEAMHLDTAAIKRDAAPIMADLAGSFITNAIPGMSLLKGVAGGEDSDPLSYLGPIGDLSKTAKKYARIDQIQTEKTGIVTQTGESPLAGLLTNQERAQLNLAVSRYSSDRGTYTGIGQNELLSTRLGLATGVGAAGIQNMVGQMGYYGDGTSPDLRKLMGLAGLSGRGKQMTPEFLQEIVGAGQSYSRGGFGNFSAEGYATSMAGFSKSGLSAEAAGGLTQSLQSQAQQKGSTVNSMLLAYWMQNGKSYMEAMQLAQAGMSDPRNRQALSSYENGMDAESRGIFRMEYGGMAANTAMKEGLFTASPTSAEISAESNKQTSTFTDRVQGQRDIELRNEQERQAAGWEDIHKLAYEMHGFMLQITGFMGNIATALLSLGKQQP